MAVIYGIGGGESIYLLYAHMQEPAPFVLSEPIDCGQQVGKVGNSGNEYFIVEPHLHFEIRVGASANRLDALNYYDTRATEQEKIEYRRWRNSDEFQLFDPTLLIDYGIGQEDGND